VVNDIVVESGNALYQDVMDRFIHGAEVDPAELRQAWENTTQAHWVWDKPIYEEFFRAVRDVNQKLPREGQLRVLLGDPPIDWAKVEGGDATGELQRWAVPRWTYPAEVIQREVIAKGRRALVVYGDAHVARPTGARNLTNVLLGRSAKVFSIGVPISSPTSPNLTAIQADVADWKTPALVMLRGTTIGAAPGKALYGAWPAPGPAEEQLDAILYLGPASSITMSPVSPARCADPAYVAMRTKRMGMMRQPPPPAPSLFDEFKRRCGLDSK
jgi:hypothetical protein